MEKYWYDANGQRVKKQNSVGEVTYYVNQFYEIDNGTATSYFFHDDECIAKETDEGKRTKCSLFRNDRPVGPVSHKVTFCAAG
ncbi:MAG: hypothetical protein PWQ63_1565 [Methanolobus sp.]|nr:hypothetical protein [Methanolobus sp.]MDK2948405.1 hypothetical protein [Methanolobus sp.]